jgi:lipopolysaccharide biosynthesis protein
LNIESIDFDVEPLGPIFSTAARVPTLLIKKRKKILRFPHFSIFSAGPRPARRIFWATTRTSIENGAAMNGPIIEQYPELLLGWSEESPPGAVEGRVESGSLKYAIVIHIYYEDIWREISTILRRLKGDFGLIITVSSEKQSLIEDIRCAFPQAEIHLCENRGRDIRPFLVLLEQGRFDCYRAVCKIHGKKSYDGTRLAVLGSVWRRRILFDLLAAPRVVAAILDRFANEPRVGMIGSRAYRYPSPSTPEKRSWGENRRLVSEIAAKMGVSAERLQLDYFAGTMFWVRPEALRPLRELRLAEAFPAEIGKVDGALEHAVERLFSTSAVAAGYRIEAIDGCDVADGRQVEIPNSVPL